MQYCRQLVSVLSSRRPESETRPFCVRYVVKIVTEGWVCLSTAVLFCQCHSSNDIRLSVYLSQMTHNLSKTQHHYVTYLEIHFLLGHHAKRANVAVRCTLKLIIFDFPFFVACFTRTLDNLCV